MRDVVVVVPIYRSRLSADEELALVHLEHYLGRYDRCLLAPTDLDVSPVGDRGEVVRFDNDFFLSTASYSRLLMDPSFYQRFASYGHLLVYQLDCLVFADRLRELTSLGFDYIGAPWLRSRAHPERGFSRVGNGGLSLRRVESCFRVLSSRRGWTSYPRILLELYLADRGEFSSLSPRERIRKRLSVAAQVARGIGWYRHHYSLNEDRFWSDRAVLFDPRFRVADVETGLAFSFEAAPRYCYDHNDQRLPFGCHGWSRWDRAFWEPHLLRPASGR